LVLAVVTSAPNPAMPGMLASGLAAPSAVCLAWIACERAIRSPALLGMLTLMLVFSVFRKTKQAFLTYEYGQKSRIFQKTFVFAILLGFRAFPEWILVFPE
jgi:hypothetical protein